jgi:hypothetical protein
MTTTELRESLRLLNAQENALADLLLEPNPIWIPLPGPQEQAWLSEADELYYGGGAGGGKSSLLVGLALTAHRKSIIFRREYAQLRDLLDYSQQVAGLNGRLSFGPPPFLRMNNGRRIEFGASEHPGDVTKYQGRPHDGKFFDELPQFLESQYRFLIGWNRTTIPGQRCRVVGAGNPPTDTDGEWVIRRWAPWLDGQHPRPALPGELRWFAVIDGQDTEVENGAPFDFKDECIEPRSRTFIPARLSDNPYLERSGYRAILQAFPEPLRSQMLYGDFTAGTDDDPWQVIPTAWVRAAQARWSEEKPTGPMTAVGVDVARGGRDKFVLARRWGAWYAPIERHPGKETPDGREGARLVIAALAEGGYANVDVIGVGASTVDIAQMQDANVNAINFAESAPGMDRTGLFRFTNLRAYAYWAMREALDPEKGDGIMLPPDAELRADLCAPKWTMRTNGIQIEAKEDIIERIGRSPDAGDAVVMASLLEHRTGFYSF